MRKALKTALDQLSAAGFGKFTMSLRGRFAECRSPKARVEALREMRFAVESAQLVLSGEVEDRFDLIRIDLVQAIEEELQWVK